MENDKQKIKDLILSNRKENIKLAFTINKKLAFHALDDLHGCGWIFALLGYWGDGVDIMYLLRHRSYDIKLLHGDILHEYYLCVPAYGNGCIGVYQHKTTYGFYLRFKHRFTIIVAMEPWKFQNSMDLYNGCAYDLSMKICIGEVEKFLYQNDYLSKLGIF